MILNLLWSLIKHYSQMCRVTWAMVVGMFLGALRGELGSWEVGGGGRSKLHHL